MRNPLRLIVLAVAPLFVACYMQRPLTTPVPEASTRIVALVTDTGRAELAKVLGANAQEVEGVVVTANPSAWDLQVMRVDYRGGQSTPWSGERVTFPRYALTDASVRTFNRKRSWVIAGIITGTAILAAKLFGAINFGGSSGGEPPPPN